MSFVDIPNTTQESRSIIYDILATYNLILLDQRREPLLNKIKDEHNLELPNLNEEEFKSKLTSLFKTEWNVSLDNVIKASENDKIFSEIINKLK